jgi:hypothetical protein
MLIFPSSPVWANMDRQPLWAEEITVYDTGLRQGSSIRSRPLYRYSITAANFNEIKQAALHQFVNSLQSMVSPFLFKDPYDYQANSVNQPVTANGSGFYFVDVRSWRFIPDSASLVIADARSGVLANGTHYAASLDNGWITHLVAVSSTWRATTQYFRKVAFDAPYSERSPTWNVFAAGLVIQEIPPST